MRMAKKKKQKNKKEKNKTSRGKKQAQNLKKPELMVGGQAVIEGVMMRTGDRYATAVRHPSGKIVVKQWLMMKSHN